MSRRVADFFCCAGGAARGYQQAGFYVVGVDLYPQPRYAGDEFIQADALKLLADRDFLSQFDFIHASPPCQRYSKSVAQKNRANHPDLIAPTRELLRASGLPWVIENVPGSPLLEHITLCGSAFATPPEPTVMRHRWFESSLPLVGARCRHDLWPPRYKPAWNRTTPLRFVNVSGGWGEHDWETKQRAMGIDWMTPTELSEAIPPAYARYVGEQVLAALEAAA